MNLKGKRKSAMKSTLSLCFVLFFYSHLFAQSGIIKGEVFNKLNNEPVPFANVVIQGTTQGVVSDAEGKYELNDLNPGLYNIEVSYVGFETLVIYEIQVTNARPAIVNFPLEESTKALEGVEITASSYSKTDESPVSLRSIGPNEIRRNPGGNRDISRVIRSLPGVASTVSFRNDIIIRGGAPGENKFFLDGIEVPVINHFQTQGSSGGPVGMINVDFIKQVDFYSGAFPVNRGNALSSVFDFYQKDGRDDKLTFNGIVGATDLGVTFEGPVTDESTFIFSARRSYLQFLFKALQLPFLPIYNDYQFKYKHKFDQKNQLSIISIGAIDNFELNLDANETEEQQYILNYLPVSEQWNYTIGAKYDHFRKNGSSTIVLSRSMLDNTSFKYANNDDSDPENLIFDYESREIENRLRLEDYSEQGPYNINYGINYEYAIYNVRDFSKRVTPVGVNVRDFNSTMRLHKWGAFGQVSRSFLQDKLTLSLGARADANDYSSSMGNPLDQFSPRFSASYYLTPSTSLNFNTGIYYQLPPYTVLGYRNSETGELENKENGVTYIRNKHLVTGLEFNLKKNTNISVEGFYKDYDNYPFLITDSINLANLGADFGVIGNDPVSSIGDGRSYGVELLAQQKLFKGFYGLLAYTYVRSEFTDKNNNLVPSAWDNRHIISLTGGKKFNRNWELGVRWLYSGGSPFTPYDIQRTVRKENWDIRGVGIPDYSRLNTERNSAFHQLDLRIDKKFFFNKWSLDVYFDIQNAYGYEVKLQDNIDVIRDDQGNPVEDPNNPGFYQPKFLENTSGTVLPTIGIIVEL